MKIQITNTVFFVLFSPYFHTYLLSSTLTYNNLLTINITSPCCHLPPPLSSYNLFMPLKFFILFLDGILLSHPFYHMSLSSFPLSIITYLFLSLFSPIATHTSLSPSAILLFLLAFLFLSDHFRCSKTVYLFAVAQLLFVYAILGVALVITICLACGQKCVTLFGESYK